MDNVMLLSGPEPDTGVLQDTDQEAKAPAAKVVQDGLRALWLLNSTV